MNHKTIKIENAEFIIGVPYTFIQVFRTIWENIIDENGNTTHRYISPYTQWNTYMKRKIDEGNRIIQNVTFSKAYADADPDNSIAIKFEVIYTE